MPGSSKALSTALEHGKRNRPCDACRRRKSKCVTEDGNTICVLCKFHEQQCTYLEAPQPRKRVNPANTPETWPLKRARIIRTKPGTGVEELSGPSLLTRTLGLQNNRHSEYVGPNGIPDVYVMGSHATELQNTSGNGTTNATVELVRFVDPAVAFRIVPDTQAPGYEQEQSDIDAIEATATGYGPDLVQLYFRIVHPSFPVLHKAVFIEKYARSYREFSPPLLAAVYLLASAYWSYSETLVHETPIDTAKLQMQAFVALQNTMRRPKLSTIQGGILLSQYQKAFMGNVPHEQRDRLTVQLVSLAHGLGLHLDCSTWDIPDWEIGLRRRIAWALYMQDKWTALLEGRPSLISNDDWEVESLIEEDFPETDEDEQEGSSEVQRGRLVFVHMTNLSVILSDVLRDVFSARARREIDQAPEKLAATLNQMKVLQIRLKDWSLTLPEALRMESVPAMKLCSVGYLRLALLGLEVSLHRNLLRALLDSNVIDQNLAHICRAAATERFNNATDFVHRLQAQHLASFWYFTAAKCCALTYSLGLILELTSQTIEEKAVYSNKLRAFRWSLKVNGEAGANFMKQALTYINQPVRVEAQSPEVHSAMASPMSADTFALTSNEASEQQTAWYPQRMAEEFSYIDFEQSAVPGPTMYGFYETGMGEIWEPS